MRTREWKYNSGLLTAHAIVYQSKLIQLSIPVSKFLWEISLKPYYIFFVCLFTHYVKVAHTFVDAVVIIQFLDDENHIIKFKCLPAKQQQITNTRWWWKRTKKHFFFIDLSLKILYVIINVKFITQKLFQSPPTFPRSSNPWYIASHLEMIYVKCSMKTKIISEI